jgi:F5/8 type C domain/His Kinase A (phospho-acceptor) domain
MAGNAQAISWRLGKMAFFHGKERVNFGGPYSFTSAWKSAAIDEEWVSVDLSASFSFDRVKLHWLAHAAEGKLQVSDDDRHWRDVQALNPADESVSVDDLKLTIPVTGRYVRVLMTRPSSPNGYIISEMEVFGHGGLLVGPQPMPEPNPDGALNIAGEAWKLQRAGYAGMKEGGEVLSTVGYRDDSWIPASVPGTVLTSYLNVGAIPDPNFGQNQLHVSDSFFYSDFWYRTEFTAPAPRQGGRTVLHLAGINWKAEVYLNSIRLGNVEGGFMRGQFDVTDKLQHGRSNALAILICKNDTPGSCKQKTFQRSFLSRAVPLRDKRGKVVKWYGVATDIQDRKHAEQLQTDLAHINRVSSMGELVASISHELAQPVTVTTAYARASLRWLQHDPPNLTEVRKGTERIIQAGVLASEIINRLRSLYKKSPCKRELIAINEVIAEMASMLRTAARRHGVSLRTPSEK